MKKELELLAEFSRKLGRNKSQIIAAGGNTSWKKGKSIWVKASGKKLGYVTPSDFVECDLKMLESNLEKKYSKEPEECYREARRDMLATRRDPDSSLEPSVETSIHVLLRDPFVAHTHPTLINALTSSKGGKNIIRELFPDNSVFIEYKYPGIALFSGVKKEIETFRRKHSSDPDYIFLKNHGIVVGGKSPEKMEEKFERLFNTIIPLVWQFPDSNVNEVEKDKVLSILPAIRMILSDEKTRVIRFRSCSLSDHFMESEKRFMKIHRSFCFDHVKHGEGKYLFIEKSIEDPGFLDHCKNRVMNFFADNGFLPKVFMIKDFGVVYAGDTARDADDLADIFEDQMKISYLSENFGGPEFLPDSEIELIRERLGYGSPCGDNDTYGEGLVGGKVAIVTGGAQGFGEGIVRSLFNNRANVVVADLNEEAGNSLAEEINDPLGPNRLVFIKTDVSDPASVDSLIENTVRLFGGLDLMISNAGVLFAGGLDEMDADRFDLVTRVNYKGYFLCAKYSSAVMELQSKYSTTHYTDIIQINSKSGLKGSNKNFAYAGGKFGGIGLTQSFAMELMPYRIKVNSIAPGNFFDGPLWSDPENGLFMQYLRAGKVPGAKTVYDVKRYYESQVPANRGCTVEDVMKALYYVIDQKYETGQAVPVTGGQIMLK